MIKKIAKLLFWFFLGLFFFTSCASKKTVKEYQNKIGKDTIYKNVTKLVTKEIRDTILIEKPCDSLGNLKDFSKTIKNDKAEILVKNIKGRLYIKLQVDSLKDITTDRFEASFKKEVEIKEVEVVRNKTPFWMWLLLIGSVLFNVLLMRMRQIL